MKPIERSAVIDECRKAIVTPGYVSCNDDFSRGYYRALEDVEHTLKKLKRQKPK